MHNDIISNSFEYLKMTESQTHEQESISDIPDNINVDFNDDDISNVSLDQYLQKSKPAKVAQESTESARTRTANFLTELLESDDDPINCDNHMQETPPSKFSSVASRNSSHCLFENNLRDATKYFKNTSVDFSDSKRKKEFAQLEVLVSNIVDKSVALAKRRNNIVRYEKRLKEMEIETKENMAIKKSKENAKAEAIQKVNLLLQEHMRLNSKIEREKRLLNIIESDLSRAKVGVYEREKKILVAKNKHNKEKCETIGKEVEDLRAQLKNLVGKAPKRHSDKNFSVEAFLGGNLWSYAVTE